MAGLAEVSFPQSFLDSRDDEDHVDTDNLQDGEQPDSDVSEQPASVETHEGKISVDDLMARAEESGLYDARELKELRAGFLRQADYTKKTQELGQQREQVQQIVQERDWLLQQFKAGVSGGKAAAQTPDKPQDEVEALLAALPSDDDDPNAAGMRKFLADYAAAVEKRTLAKAEQGMAPVKLKAAEDQFITEMQSHYTAMRDKYGEGIDAKLDTGKTVFETCVEYTLHHRKNGERATPESVLTLYAPDHAIALRQSAKSKQSKTKTRDALDRSMEGSERIRYRKPVESADDVPTSQREVDTSATATAERVMTAIANGRNASHFRAGMSRL